VALQKDYFITTGKDGASNDTAPSDIAHFFEVLRRRERVVVMTRARERRSQRRQLLLYVASTAHTDAGSRILAVRRAS
jgi:hypothetical protein